MPGLIDSPLTSAKLSEANTTLNMMFKQAFNRDVPLDYTEFTTETTSGGAATKYPIMGGMTGLREWLGERVYETFRRYAYMLVNKKFEKSVEVPVDDIADDQLDSYGSIMEGLAYQAKLWPQDQVYAALKAGGASLCFDGQFFFDTDHPTDPGETGSATYANLFTSTPLTSANFSAVLAAMQLIPNRDGRPLGFDAGGQLRLVVPPQLREVGNQIVNAPFLASGATNVNAGLAKLLVIPSLGQGGGVNATNWYLMQTGGAFKPLIWQKRQAPTLTSMTNLNDPNVFEKDVFRWGLKARGVAGYGLPWLAAKAMA